MLAYSRMKQLRLDSILDTYYAAIALMHLPDKTIISTDSIFDKVTGLSRADLGNM